MKRLSLVSALLGAVLVLDAAGAAAQQQRNEKLPDGETILRRIESRWAAVKDYSVTIDAVADIDRMEIPPMVVKMYYKSPDKMHFESEGFAVLPRDALRFNPRGIRDRFSVEAVTRDSAEGKYRVKLISRGETTPVRRLTMLVDPQNYTIDALETGTTDGRRMKASFSHAAVDGVLMPSSLLVEFTSDSPAESPVPEPAQGPPRPRRGKVTITFKDYKLNTGLSDEIFLKKEQ